MGDTSENVIVAVRVRPFSRRERAEGAECIVRMKENETQLIHSSDPSENRSFFFDYAFWSHEPLATPFASQEDVYNVLGTRVLDSATEGYNVSCFAYGQTGAGKSYTMMGTQSDPGLIPRVCANLFEHVDAVAVEKVKHVVEVSMLEIYNESLRDLFNPALKNQRLRVREHPKTGPYVEGLTPMVTTSATEVQTCLQDGLKARTIAATNMNAESSRSHTVFQIHVRSLIPHPQRAKPLQRRAKISLVDLAGSEKVNDSGVEGERLKEAQSINRSLSAFGNCISALARSAKTSKKVHVPYRDSMLTWLLRDSLGGTARTIMIAALSPASMNYEETLSTLRYADRAKQIRQRVTLNTDTDDAIIMSLEKERDALRAQLERLTTDRSSILSQQPAAVREQEQRELRERLEENERIMREFSMTFEERVERTKEYKREREQALREMGLSFESTGLHMKSQDTPFLVNLSDDALLNEVFVYKLGEESTLVGSSKDCALQLTGALPLHALISRTTEEGAKSAVLVQWFRGAHTFVNGRDIAADREEVPPLSGEPELVAEGVTLRHGDRICFGTGPIFRFSDPTQGSVEKSIEWQDAVSEIVGGESRTSMLQKRLDDMQAKFAEERARAQERLSKSQQTTEELSRQVDSLPDPEAAEMERLRRLDDVSRLRSSLDDRRLFRMQQLVNRWETARLMASVERLVRGAIDGIRDANRIAKEMRRRIAFQFVLRPRMADAAGLTPEVRLRHLLECDVLVRVTNRETRSIYHWSMQKFKDRLKLIHMLWDMMIVRQIDVLVPVQRDPFHESLVDERVGTAFLFLGSVLKGRDAAFDLPILNARGATVGILKVAVNVRDGKPAKLGEATAFDVLILRAMELSGTATDVYVRFSLFGDETVYVTKRAFRAKMEAEFNHREKFRIPEISPGALRCFHKDAIALELWGTPRARRLDPERDPFADLRELGPGLAVSMEATAPEESPVASEGAAPTTRGRRRRATTVAAPNVPLSAQRRSAWEFGVDLEVFEGPSSGQGIMEPIEAKIKSLDRTTGDGQSDYKVFGLYMNKKRRLVVSIVQATGQFNVLDTVASVHIWNGTKAKAEGRSRAAGPAAEDNEAAPTRATRPIKLNVIKTERRLTPHKVVAVCEFGEDVFKYLQLFRETPKNVHFSTLTVKVKVALDLEHNPYTEFVESLHVKMHAPVTSRPRGDSMLRAIGGSMKRKLGAGKKSTGPYYSVGSRYRCQLLSQRRKSSEDIYELLGRDPDQIISKLLQQFAADVESLEATLRRERERQTLIVDGVIGERVDLPQHLLPGSRGESPRPFTPDGSDATRNSLLPPPNAWSPLGQGAVRSPSPT